jgi:hypothetical protein
MTVKELIEKLQPLRPDVLLFAKITTAEGKTVIGSIEAVGKEMYEVVYLKGKEE